MSTSKSNTEHKKTLPKPNNIVTVPATIDTDFFKWWCVFLKPFISLSKREIDVVASLLKQRWELSNIVLDPTVLDSMVMSHKVREKVMEECGLTLKHYYVVISKLRKNKVIVGNNINPRLVPNIRKGDEGVFQLLILFKGINKSQ